MEINMISVYWTTNWEHSKDTDLEHVDLDACDFIYMCMNESMQLERMVLTMTTQEENNSSIPELFCAY